MSAQTTLTDDAPMILDATCSYRSRTHWPRSPTLRMDVRKKVRPDIVADARFMPFQSAVIDEEFKDPPHLFRKGNLDFIKRHRLRSGRTSPGQFERYGYWESRAKWLDFIQKSMPESHRILKSSGQLHIKLTPTKDGRLKIADIPMDGFELVKSPKITKSQSRLPSKCNVFWLTMKPKPTGGTT